MGESRSRESLKKFAQAIEGLDPDRRIAAAKWLEGVIVAQTLTPEEREHIIIAANEYIESVEEDEYMDAVNALIEFLERTKRSANRTLKKVNNKRLTEERVLST